MRSNPRTAKTLLLARLEAKAGVQDCHPHRLRHTFAETFLPHREAAHRNGANAFELQTACPAFSGMALGHTTLQTACPAVQGMVQTYLALAQADPSTALRTSLDAAHRRALPIENWRLLGM